MHARRNDTAAAGLGDPSGPRSSHAGRTRRGRRAAALAASMALPLVALVAVPGWDATAGASGAGTSPAAGPTTPAGATSFDAVIRQIEDLPYTAAYVPEGYDSAFPTDSVLNDFPAEDYTSGSIPDSPDSPTFPAPFEKVLLHSGDGAPFYAEVALHPGRRPAIEVVPGFNTHSARSVVRWAAMLSANGYDVIAADQRDFSTEYDAGYGYPDYPQTFGWKEAQDVVAAGEYMRQQNGVSSLGIVGFSEGGQDTVLAMADAPHLYTAGLTFSAPATQDTQIYSTAEPSGCTTPACTYPATDALVGLVVPPYTYTNVCTAISYAASSYGTTGYDILADESAFHAQTQIKAPLLNFYSADDSLVPSFEAEMMAGYEQGEPLQKTLEVEHGEHAYFFDRWWQQSAILDYFAAELPAPKGAGVTSDPTVNQTPGGTPLATQLVTLGAPTRAAANADMAPYVCTTSQGKPGAASEG